MRQVSARRRGIVCVAAIASQTSGGRLNLDFAEQRLGVSGLVVNAYLEPHITNCVVSILWLALEAI